MKTRQAWLKWGCALVLFAAANAWAALGDDIDAAVSHAVKEFHQYTRPGP